MSQHRRKPCKQCGQVLTLRNFYRHPNHADGHMNTCRKCHAINVAENKALKYEHYSALRRRLDSTPQARARRQRYWLSERGKKTRRERDRFYWRLRVA